MSALTADVDYQQRFRRAFVTRRLHPTTEIKVWEYALGKPKEQIEMSANLSLDARLAAEVELLRQLDLRQLEELAAASQALVDKAVMMAKGNARVLTSGDLAAHHPPADDADSSGGEVAESPARPDGEDA